MSEDSQPAPQEKPREGPVGVGTGGEPMTGPQRSCLQMLGQEAGEEPAPAELTKAQASELIERLQDKVGRGGN